MFLCGKPNLTSSPFIVYIHKSSNGTYDIYSYLQKNQNNILWIGRMFTLIGFAFVWFTCIFRLLLLHGRKWNIFLVYVCICECFSVFIDAVTYIIFTLIHSKQFIQISIFDLSRIQMFRINKTIYGMGNIEAFCCFHSKLTNRKLWFFYEFFLAHTRGILIYIE